MLVNRKTWQKAGIDYLPLKKENVETIGSESINLVKSNAIHAKWRADVALFTTEAYLDPNRFSNFFSKLLTCGPVVRKSDFKTLDTADISDLSINCRE